MIPYRWTFALVNWLNRRACRRKGHRWTDPYNSGTYRACPRCGRRERRWRTDNGFEWREA